MADPWIRMRVTLAQDPTILALGLSLGNSAGIPPESPRRVRRRVAVALLLETWGLFHVEADATGLLPGYSLADIDEHVAVDGWAQALVDVGWLIVSPEGITAYAFDEWIGSKKKNQEKDRERKRAKRACPVEVRRNSEGSPPDSSSSDSSSDSSSLPDPDLTRAGAPEGERPRRRTACSLDEHLGELEFSTLRSDVVDAARDWSRTRAEGGLSAWGRRQWRPALRRAIQDPAGFIAAVAHSGDQGYAGLVAPKGGKGAAPERKTAREASDDDFYASWDRFMDAQGIPKTPPPCSTSTSPAKLSVGSATSPTPRKSNSVLPAGTSGSPDSTPR